MEHEATQLVVIGASYLIALIAAPFCALLVGPTYTRHDRYQHLDGLRAIAAVGVVACHINQYACSFLGFQGQSPVLGDHVGILGVQMFFALTAFLFTERALAGKLQVAEFCVGRVRRIVPLYVFAAAMTVILGFYYTRVASFPVAQNLNEIVKIFTYGFWQEQVLTFRGLNMLPLIGIAWTLSYEWIFYLLLVPLLFLWQAGSLFRIAVVAAVTILAARDFWNQSEQNVWPFFLPGVLAAFVKPHVPPLGRPISALLAASVIPAFILVLYLPGFWTPPKLALAGWIFMAVLFSNPAILRIWPLQTLGLVSYSIYLLQYLVLYPMMRQTYSYPDVWVKLAICAMAMFMVIVLAGLSYRYIERPWLTPRKAADPARRQAGTAAQVDAAIQKALKPAS